MSEAGEPTTSAVDGGDPHRWAAGALVAAPAGSAVGLALLKFVWNAKPRWPWSAELAVWVTAHVAYLASYVAYAGVLALLWADARSASRGSVGRVLTGVVGVLGVVGLVAVLGQMVLDLVIGFRAGSRAGMDGAVDAIQATPGVEPVFYGAVPAMQLVVVVVLVVVLAVRRRMSGWGAAAVVLGFVGVASGLPVAMVAGSLVMAVGLHTAPRPGRVRAPRSHPASRAIRAAS